MTSEVEEILYPDIDPFKQFHLQVDETHTLYVEECGNPGGKPVVFLHGGPGGGILPTYRRFFNPDKYRVILFDQRGCGKSTPHASLQNNTTWDLVADIEKIRKHCGIEQWQVFGGSWGSTLALAYAEKHPEHVVELVLRGIFLLRQKEISWFYQEGASWVFPDYWEDYIAPIPPEERSDMVCAYYARLTSSDLEIAKHAAVAWSRWEGQTSVLVANPSLVSRTTSEQFAYAFARIECHYFINRGFFERDDELLVNAARLKDIPGTIVQGRYDLVCPAKSAWELHQRWPQSRLEILPVAAHTALDPSIAKALVRATDYYAS